MGCSLGVQFVRSHNNNNQQSRLNSTRRRSSNKGPVDDDDRRSGGGGGSDGDPSVFGNDLCRPHDRNLRENQSNLTTTVNTTGVSAEDISDEEELFKEEEGNSDVKSWTEVVSSDKSVDRSESSKSDDVVEEQMMSIRSSQPGAFNLPALLPNDRLIVTSQKQIDGHHDFSLPAIVSSHPDKNFSATQNRFRTRELTPRVQSPHVHNMRLHHEHQSSATTSNHLPPVRSSRSQASSSSSNDYSSWLTEILDENDLDEDDDEDDDKHLPIIDEVDSVIESDDIRTINRTSSPALVQSKTKHSQRPVVSRNCWSSSSSPRHNNISTSRSLIHDCLSLSDNLRLPPIPEDFASANFTRTSDQINHDNHKEEEEEERDIERIGTTFLDPQIGNLDVKDEDVSVVSDYGIRMYITSVTGLLDMDNIDPRDFPVLKNITIDPSSPLLVQCVNSQKNRNDDESIKATNKHRMTNGHESGTKNVVSSVQLQDDGVFGVVDTG